MVLAHDALELAKKFHKNKRKDNVTPEFEHQLSIVGYLLSLENNLLFPEETVTVAFLHDLSEDYDIGYQEIKERFGEKISLSVQLLTKKYQGSKKDNIIYFQEMENNALASVVKGADRINNLQSMGGVFNNDKQKEYIKETEDFIIQMLKNSRKIFP